PPRPGSHRRRARRDRRRYRLLLSRRMARPRRRPPLAAQPLPPRRRPLTALFPSVRVLRDPDRPLLRPGPRDASAGRPHAADVRPAFPDRKRIVGGHLGAKRALARMAGGEERDAPP